MTNKSLIISIFFFIITIVLVQIIKTRGVPVVVKTNLENIPMKIGAYTAANDDFDQSVYDELNADVHIYRHYHAPDHPTIDLYIGYYGTAKGGRTGHNPYACLPGGGWGILKDETIKIPIDTNTIENVKYTLTGKNGSYLLVMHWYQSEDKILQTGFKQNINRFFNLIINNRNDGAFVRISANTQQQDKIMEIKSEIQNFTSMIIPILPEFWPVEKKLK